MTSRGTRRTGSRRSRRRPRRPARPQRPGPAPRPACAAAGPAAGLCGAAGRCLQAELVPPAPGTARTIRCGAAGRLRAQRRVQPGGDSRRQRRRGDLGRAAPGPRSAGPARRRTRGSWPRGRGSARSGACSAALRRTAPGTPRPHALSWPGSHPFPRLVRRAVRLAGSRPGRPAGARPPDPAQVRQQGQQPGPAPGAAALHRARGNAQDLGGVGYRVAEHVHQDQRGPLFRGRASGARRARPARCPCLSPDRPAPSPGPGRPASARPSRWPPGARRGGGSGPGRR